MNYGDDASCLDRLQREALTCLNGFPNKIRALNDIIAAYAPKAAKQNLKNALPKISGLLPPERSIAEKSNSDKFDSTLVSQISGGTNLQSISRQSTPQKKHRTRRLNHKILRRRPGPLAHILAFLSNSLALCTKATVIRPSRFIANHALTMLRDTLIQRGRLINAQCGPSEIWSLPEDRASLELQIDLGATFINCIGIMRPAAAQLIADTTKLKRWLQALALTFTTPTSSLTYAMRKTEAIDGWAYELFFHLKYLQENRIRNSEKVALEFKANDDVRYANLWHRLVQLRDNYLYLYETLYYNNEFRKFTREPTATMTSNSQNLIHLPYR